MRSFLIILCVLLCGCSNSDVETNETWAQHNMKNIIYVKDSRTGICFAYIDSFSTRGVGSIASCDCEKIPKELLKEIEFE